MTQQPCKSLELKNSSFSLLHAMAKNKPLTMRWVNPAKGRYYFVALSQDLFNDWILTKVWGSTCSARGNRKSEYCHSYEQGIALAEQLNKLRLKRGYILTED